jgi:hypothetical protein
MRIHSTMRHGLSVRQLDISCAVLKTNFHENFEKLKFKLNAGNMRMYKQNSITEQDY